MAIPKLEALMTSSTLKQGLMLINTVDRALQALFSMSRLEVRPENVARAARLNWYNLNLNDLSKYKK
jgi:hypothetical protein